MVLRLAALPAADVSRAIDNMEQILKMETVYDNRQLQYHLQTCQLEHQRRLLDLEFEHQRRLLDLKFEHQRLLLGLEIERMRSARMAERHRSRGSRATTNDGSIRRRRLPAPSPQDPEAVLGQLKDTRRRRGKLYANIERAVMP